MNLVLTRSALTAFVVVAAFAGGVSAALLGDTTPRSFVDRAPYRDGWSFSVAHQTGPDPVTGRTPTDDATAAWCRLWADGAGHEHVTDRAAFVAGCDDATQRTALEAP